MTGMGNHLIREARKRTGLSQRELAERAGTTQSAVARIETGASTPTFDSVMRYLRLCGLDLDIMLVERDDSDWCLARAVLPLTRAERVERSMRVARSMWEIRRSGTGVTPRGLEPGPILAALRDHGVRFVVIGGMAAAMHGSPIATEDLDVTVDDQPGNLTRLSTALDSLECRPNEDDGPTSQPATPAVRRLVTRHGALDIVGVPSGTRGFPDLMGDASEETLFGVVVSVASLADVIRSKQAANRPKDQRVLPVLREILARRND